MSEEHRSTVKVLLAERDKSSRDMLNQYFNDQGWSFDAVEDTESLLSAIQSREYDLVVTDLLMPELQGLELLRKIKEYRPSQSIVVVADEELAGSADECMRSMRALDILHRPLQKNVVSGVLGRIITALKAHSLRGDLDKENIAEISFPYKKTYTFTSQEYDAQKLKIPVLDLLLQAGKIELNVALRIELAFQEAVTNALEHGNLELESVWKEQVDENGRDRYSTVKQQRLQDPTYSFRKIHIEVWCVENLLSITIRDEGKGFPLDTSVETKNSSEDLYCHGRGLTIMNSVMDEVTYAEGGSVVKMEKKLV